MEFHKLRNGRSIQRPTPDADDLTEERALFKGEFEIDEAHIGGGDQRGVQGEGEIRHSLIEHVNLAQSQLTKLTLTDVLLNDLDLSNAQIMESIFRSVEFRRCRAIGLRIAVDQAADLYMQDTRLDFAVLDFQRIKGVAAFIDCSFREATLIGDWSDVVFENCDFIGAEFRATRAKGCDLKTSRLDGAHGLASLKGATISAEQAASIAAQLAAEVGLIVEP
jgi:uncharacterized protein YjbI with pentapeptide repeats